MAKKLIEKIIYTPPPPLLIIKIGKVYYRRMQPVPFVNNNKFENLKNMSTLKLNKLKEQYEFVCNEYVAEFCNKQEMDFEGWYLFCIFVYEKNNRNIQSNIPKRQSLHWAVG